MDELWILQDQERETERARRRLLAAAEIVRDRAQRVVRQVEAGGRPNCLGSSREAVRKWIGCAVSTVKRARTRTV